MDLAKEWVRHLTEREQWVLTTAKAHPRFQNWAWIRPATTLKGWELLVWENDGGAWWFKTIGVLPTLGEAKHIGRMLAGLSIQKNF